MRELMQSRDDRRADKLEAKAPTGELCFFSPPPISSPLPDPTTLTPLALARSHTPVTSLEWPRPLTVVRYPDPRLRAVNATIGSFDDTLKAFAQDMLSAMYDDEGGSRDSGVGLAAPQVGVNVRLMVFNPTGDPAKKDEEVVLINPRLVSTGGGLVVGEEGCLSFPGIYGDVARPARAKVRAQRLDGSTFQISLTGFPARVFLHEFDHLQGVLFHERMEPGAAAEAAPRLRALEEAWEKAQQQ
jgi:peptide deformylase